MATANRSARRFFLTRLYWLLACVWLAPAVHGSAATNADLRLLLETSGQIAQSDPHNRRLEGLSLLTQLLPAGTHAGLWRFDDTAHELVAAAPVDDRWRQSALNALQKLPRQGQSADLGAALARAARLPKTAERAHILLLTDGGGSIHPDPERSAHQRHSIMTELVPNLVARGFVIHAIALSADADTTLLQAIAAASGGEYQVVNDSAQLLPMLVALHDQITAPQRLPIKGKGFQVDAHVDQLTLLLYHSNKAPAARLLDPDFRAVSAAQHDRAQVRWQSRPEYQLITIDNPERGRWQWVNASQVRVTALTDIAVQILQQPHTALPSEPIELGFVLREPTPVATKGALFETVVARLSVAGQADSGQFNEPQPLLSNTRPAKADGVFKVHSAAPETPGHYQLTLQVTGSGFTREYQHYLQVGSGFTVALNKRVDPQASAAMVTYQLEVAAAPALNAERTKIVAHIKDSTGVSSLQPLKQVSAQRWVLDITPERHARYVIELQAKGVAKNDRVFSQALAPQYFTYPAEGDPQPPIVDDAVLELEQALAAERRELARQRGLAVAEPEPVHEVAQLASSSAASVAPAEADNGTRWWLVILLVLFNGALLLLVYGLYRRFSGASLESELDELTLQLDEDEQTDAAQQELPAGAFDDVFADMDDVAAPAQQEANTVQLDDEQPVVNLDNPAAPEADDPAAPTGSDEPAAVTKGPRKP